MPSSVCLRSHQGITSPQQTASQPTSPSQAILLGLILPVTQAHEPKAITLIT